MDIRDERNQNTERPAGSSEQTRRRTGEGRRRYSSGRQSRVSSARPGDRPGRRPSTARRSRRARRRRRNQIIRWMLFIILICGLSLFFLLWQRYGMTKERADLNSYFGLESDDQIGVVVNSQVVKSSTGFPAGKVYDGTDYIEYSVLRDLVNSRFYYDFNENILLYTLPTGNVSAGVGSREYTDINETMSEDYQIVKTEGKVAYVAVPFVEKYTNMAYEHYDDPGRVVIQSKWGKTDTAAARRDTQVRYQAGVKSPILSDISKDDKLVVLEDEGDWKKVATEDGFIGYVPVRALKDQQTIEMSHDFEEPVYTNISENKTINMAWHNVENADANNYILTTIAKTKGLTVVAPTWFSIADTNGNLRSIADSSYVNFAHQSNLKVWAVLRDFHGGINSYDETYEVLSYTSKRTTLINQVISQVIQSGIDGINLDFELVSDECGEHFIQFVRELSVKCRQNGIVFSVDNYVPQPYNEHYDIEEQGKVADYVVLMAYDEHTAGSKEAGSVSSYDYVKNGISDGLQKVPAKKLVAGIPFYTRLWSLTPKTSEELKEQSGSEEGDYAYNVDSTALGMKEAQDAVAAAGVQASWDDQTKQNFAQWEENGVTKQIWLEDQRSIEEKLKLIKESGLAGVAEWKLGFEESYVWDLILQYVN